MNQTKPTKKQKAQRTAAERSKYQRRLAKSSSSGSGDVLGSISESKERVDKAILKAHLDRIVPLLPRTNYKSMPMPTQPGKRPWMNMPYAALKRNVGWIATNKQDNYISPKGVRGNASESDCRAHVLKRFNEEILEFSSYVELTQNETISREGVLSDLYDAVIAKWPTATVSAFGSYASGLSIYNSDLDITVEGIGVAVDDNGKHVNPSPTTSVGMSVLTSYGTKTHEVSEEEKAERETVEEGDCGALGQVQEPEEEVTFVVDRRRSASPSSAPAAVVSASVNLAGISPVLEKESRKRALSDEAEGVEAFFESKEKEHLGEYNGDNNSNIADDGSVVYGEVTVGATMKRKSLTKPEARDVFGVVLEGNDLTNEDDDMSHSSDDSSVEEEDIMHAKGALAGSPAGSGRDGSGVVHVRYEEQEDGEPPADIDCGVLVNSRTAQRGTNSQSLTSLGSVGSLTSSQYNTLGFEGTESDCDGDGDSDEVEVCDSDEDEDMIQGEQQSRRGEPSPACSTTASSFSSQKVMTLTNGAIVRVDEQFASNVSSLQSKKSKGGSQIVLEEDARRKSVSLLRNFHHLLQQLGWLEASECRSRAKVPIIALEHKAGIFCDISLGVKAATHSAVVTDLLQLVGASTFIPLSRFLKVFLGLLEMDKPFNGGVGSFKLYVMIAHVYENVAKAGPDSSARDDKEVGLAYLLRSFFKYYGTHKNLNSSTTIQVRGAVVTFDTMNLPCVQLLFQKAHNILEESLTLEVRRIIQGENSKNNHHATSCSVLAKLVDSKALFDVRRKSAGSSYYNYSAAPNSSIVINGTDRGKNKAGEADSLAVQKAKMAGDKKKTAMQLLQSLHQLVNSHSFNGGQSGRESGSAISVINDLFSSGTTAMGYVQKAHPSLAARIISYGRYQDRVLRHARGAISQQGPRDRNGGSRLEMGTSQRGTHTHFGHHGAKYRSSFSSSSNRSRGGGDGSGSGSPSNDQFNQRLLDSFQAGSRGNSNNNKSKSKKRRNIDKSNAYPEGVVGLKIKAHEGEQSNKRRKRK